MGILRRKMINEVSKGIVFVFKAIANLLKLLIKGIGWYISKLFYVFSKKETKNAESISINEEIF